MFDKIFCKNLYFWDKGPNMTNKHLICKDDIRNKNLRNKTNGKYPHKHFLFCEISCIKLYLWDIWPIMTNISSILKGRHLRQKNTKCGKNSFKHFMFYEIFCTKLYLWEKSQKKLSVTDIRTYIRTKRMIETASLFKKEIEISIISVCYYME